MEDTRLVYVQIKGGLGNQLFQYATGYYLKKKLNDDMCLDCSSAKVGQLLKIMRVKKNFSLRDIRLDCFKIDSCKKIRSVWIFLIDYIVRMVQQEKGFTGKHLVRVISETGLDCRDNHINLFGNINKNEDVILSGYWQNIHYIEPVKKDLTKQFQMTLQTERQYKEIECEIESSESVGVHVRRGDFVSLGWDKGANYYLDAIKEAKKWISNARFFFFSDDPDWVKDNLMDNIDCTQVVLTEENADVKEFNLLRKCKHQIISESTFGWWAAYLNENPNKLVFIPENCRGNIWLNEWKRV